MLMPHWHGELLLSLTGTRIHLMGPESSDHAAVPRQTETEQDMGKNNRWMTWVLADSARTDVTLPWARGTRPNWKSRLTNETPDLATILHDAMPETRVVSRSARLPRRIAVS
ncbi:hypothetical protein [Litoreibacter meonggei]|uniref:hypothetical protein n=1 Tax=Litoreibacter meonggei TaxID=1049199 RepID=UPI0014763367|nr:hypothetical protein [Litoreibacter meonggei]